MNRIAKGFLFWTPRILTMMFAVFLGLFATDVFNEGYGFWEAIGAFLIHLVPAFGVALFLAIAWRWPWMGALLFGISAVSYTISQLDGPHPLAWPAIIAGPQLLVATLFLFNWIYRSQLASRQTPDSK